MVHVLILTRYKSFLVFNWTCFNLPPYLHAFVLEKQCDMSHNIVGTSRCFSPILKICSSFPSLDILLDSLLRNCWELSKVVSYILWDLLQFLGWRCFEVCHACTSINHCMLQSFRSGPSLFYALLSCSSLGSGRILQWFTKLRIYP